jgi:hypothetical protein
MKKFFALALILSMGFAAGCEKKKPAPAPAANPDKPADGDKAADTTPPADK